MVDEVTSIIFIVAAVFEICGCLKVKPTVYIIISVLATNIGSSATVLGNPIGILIATKSGLTFEDFLVKALPLSLVCLAATIAICLIWYRKTLKEMDANIEQFKTCEVSIGGKGEPLSKDLKISMAIFAVTLAIIALHHRLEILWDLAPNTILLAMPLLSCSAVFVWKRGDARRYVEKNVEWWTLLFFMFLFAQAGTLKYTGVTDELAKRLISATGNNLNILTGCILWISSLGSAVLDNVVLVASLIPVVQSLKELAVNLKPLWWAILFGGCLGGNITLVGSTANIVALGMLEKEKNIHMTFLKWFGIGLTVGIVTTVMVWGALIFFPLYR
jgi:Na+/H+ antiporter NhaD/arsenite permease-like protein